MPTKTPPGTFSGFSSEGLKFLRDLAKNNDRAWFTPRKETYERELLEPLRELLAAATAAMRRAKIPLGSDPGSGIFRIYRDIRFSHDKSPYKTNLGAFLSRDSHHESPGGLYVHIKPKESFVAVGFYQIEKPLLQRWREAMASEPKEFEKVLRALERGDLHLSEREDALKRMPRGFEEYAQSPIAEHFRSPSFMVSEEISDQDVGSTRIVDRMVDIAKRAKPLLTYGWSL